jgi:hypothetical protein
LLRIAERVLTVFETAALKAPTEKEDDLEIPF